MNTKDIRKRRQPKGVAKVVSAEDAMYHLNNITTEAIKNGLNCSYRSSVSIELIKDIMYDHRQLEAYILSGGN